VFLKRWSFERTRFEDVKNNNNCKERRSFRNNTILFELLVVSKRCFAQMVFAYYVQNVPFLYPFISYKYCIFRLRNWRKVTVCRETNTRYERTFSDVNRPHIYVWKFVVKSRVWKIDLFIRVSRTDYLLWSNHIGKYKLNK